MSVTDINKIDGMAISLDNRELKLMISDHLDWENEYEHLLVLQKKINNYISFFEGKQFLEMYPNMILECCTLEIHFLFSPTEKAVQFLNTVQLQVSDLGIIIENHVSKGVNNENK